MAKSSPTLAGDLGKALGTFLGSGIEELAKSKVNSLKATLKKQEQRANAPQKLHSILNSLGRKDYNAEQRDEILSRVYKYYDQGMTPGEAELAGLRDYEKNPYTDDPNSPLGILQAASQKNDIPLHERTTARFTDLFKTKPQEDVLELQEKVREKSKNSKSIDEFTIDELAVMTPDIVSNLPESEQQKFYENTAPFLPQQAEGIRKLATIPFIGGGLEERAREELQPTLDKSPAIADISRIASELPFFPSALGKGNLLEKMVRGAAFFGGDAAANEAIRTLGTNKPVDLSLIGIQSLLGGVFPVGEALIKSIAKPFRNLVAKLMKSEGKVAAEVAADILKDAEKAGIKLEELEKGSEKEAAKFSQYLNEEGKRTSERVKTSVHPEEPKPKEPLKRRPETAKEGEKRFAQESKALSETPIEDYMKESPVKKTGYAERKGRIEPKIKSNDARIRELEKEVLQRSGKDLQAARNELAALKEQNYKLDYELKYGKERMTPEQLGKEVQTSLENLVANVMEGGDANAQKLGSISKRMDNFLQRAKDELVKGKLPERVAEDTFLNINKAYLEGYKDLQKFVQKQLEDPTSIITSSGIGKDLLENLNKRIKGTEAGLKVQTQKRKTLKALKPGSIGTYYRKWVDDLRKTNDLFSKDLIRTGEKISQAEKNLTPKLKKHFQEIGRKAFKESPQKLEKTLVKAGTAPSAAKEAVDALKEIRDAKTKKFSSFEDARVFFRKKMNEILKPVKNQVIAGILLGSLDQVSQETFGKKIPPKVKFPVLGAAGLYGKTGSRKPILALTAYFTDLAWHDQRIKKAKDTLKGKKGKDFLIELDKMRKSGKYTAKELKKIRESV